MLNALKHMLIAVMIGLILCPPSLVYAGGIQVDPGAAAQNQATMDAAQNGVPVVNIAAPNGSGLSHNQFLDFNVGAQGVIINNSTKVGVSQLGGALGANPNLGGGAASTILNEVTGSGRSSIQGFTEIFGQSANYILANPNGISINGGGFINTPRATLTTGVPQVSGGAFQGLDVRDGDILVEGAGANANNISAFELVSRVATINAEIYAKQLNIITGQNRHNPVTGVTTPLTPDGSALPSISIDSTALGGMYAERIKLVGTEAGVGVNTQGIVQATQHLEMTADGKIQIRNAATSANTLALTSTNSGVEISGTVKAVGTATLTGQTVTVAKVDPADTPKVNAGNVVINAGTLDNQALIAADSGMVVAATSITNTGTIYSGGIASLRVADTLLNDQGVILAKGDMTLEGAAAGQKMETLQNDSGQIESLDGGLIFRAKAFNNNNTQFVLTPGGVELAYSEGGYWSYGDEADECRGLFSIYVGTPRVGVSNTAFQMHPVYFAAAGFDSSRHVVSREELKAAVEEVDAKLALDPTYLTATEKSYLDYARSVASGGRTYIVTGNSSGVVYSATTTQDTATGQDLGSTIAAQGDILIEADDARNHVSTITSATGDITIDSTTFENVGEEIYERTTYKWGTGKFQNHHSPHIIPQGGGTEVALKVIDHAYSTIDAGNKVFISSGAVTNGVTERGGIILPSDPAAQQQKVTNVTDLISGLPSNGLFQPNTNPAYNYQIETNPALTDLNNFFGSEYGLARMGFDPNDIANKRLCDGYCETTTVRKQIEELSGRRFLENGVSTDNEQFVRLMDNAAQARTDLNLSVGVALSKEQIAALTQDIVWYERQTVNGEDVLVPVVYLGSASIDRIAKGGSVIVGKDVTIAATGDVANAGLIQSDTQVVITADNFFNAQGTVNGPSVAIAAADSIRNTGGAIEGGNIDLKAGNDVVVASDTITFQSADTTSTLIAKNGTITASGNLNIEAGRDIGILGADVAATGDAALKAGGNIVVSALETETHSATSGSGYDTTTDVVINRKSTLTTGGALTAEAGEDIAIHGSRVEAGGNVDLKAGENLAITAAKNTFDSHLHSEGKSGGFFGGDHSNTIDISQQNNVASTIKSGGALTAEAGTGGAGSLTLQGSRVEAVQDITLQAEGDVLAVASRIENSTKSEESSSGFMDTSSMESSESDTVTNVRAEIEAGGKVVINAKDDVTLQAASITSGDETEITAQDGKVSMLTAKDSTYEHEVKSDTGFFSWSSSDAGSVDETVLHTEINAGKGLTITTAQGIVVEYKETGDLRADIAQLAQAPGLEWMGEILKRDDVNWQAVQEVHNQWKEENSGIGGPGMQLVSLAMAVALSWTGVGGAIGGLMAETLGAAADSALAAAFTAGFNSLVTQAGMQIIGNGGDIGAALKAMASADMVRSLATAMLTAGLSAELVDLADIKGNAVTGTIAENTDSTFITELAKKLQTNVIQAGVSAGVNTAINGGDLGENLVANLHGAAVNALGAQVANEIGKAYQKGDLDYVTHKIAHAALGGAIDVAMGGDGTSGAIGGAVGEMTAEALAGEIEEALLKGHIDPAAAKNWIDAGVDMSKLAAGLSAAALEKDIDVAAQAGGNAARNNGVQFLAGEAALVAGLTASELSAITMMLLLGVISVEDFREASAEALKHGYDTIADSVVSIKTWIAANWQELSDEDKQQIVTPGFDITKIDLALGGTPSYTDVDNGPITTPDTSDAVEAGTVSEDQSGLIDNSGIIVSDSVDDIATRIANGHAWDKHVNDSSGDLNGVFGSPEDFAEAIADVIKNPDDMRTLKNGRKAWWDDTNGIIVIYDPKSPDKGTAFIPEEGKGYFNKIP